MLRKSSIALVLALFAAATVFVSCGGNSGSSSGNSPQVITDPGTNPVDGTTDTGSNTGGTTNNGTNTGGGTTDTGDNNVDNPTDSTPPTVIINPSGGDLTVNGEIVPPSNYNSSNTSATVTAVDETGKICVVTVSNDGIITVIPADGSLEGTYTVTIDTGEREYYLIIEVNADGDPEVTTSISYPSNSNIVLDLQNGVVQSDLNDDGEYEDILILGETLVLSSLVDANDPSKGYGIDPSISLITAQDSNGDTVEVTIDPVTGDIITGGNGSDSYIITIVKDDGTIITINTDPYGKITSIPEDGKSHVLIDVDNGTATIVPATTIGGVTIEAKIDIAEKIGSDWVKLNTITEIKAYTASGSVDSPDLQYFVDPNTGSISVPGLLFTSTTVVISEYRSEDDKTIHIIKIGEDGNYDTYSKSEVTTVNGVKTEIITAIVFDDDGQISSYIQTSVVKDNGTTTTTITTVAVGSNGSATVTVVTTVIAPDGSTTTTTEATTVESSGNSTTVTNVTYNRVMVVLTNGSITSGNTTLTLTGNSGTGYKFLTGVQILSASAADGTISVTDLSKITVDPLTGSIMINGDGTITLVGPYELKVSIGDNVYVLKTDETGRIVSIIPGNVVLQLLDGVLFYSDNEVLTMAYENNDVWTLSNAITELEAFDASDEEISISIDPYTGNFVTDGNVTGTVTITFLYTDSQGNGITYTITVSNGSVNSYTAEITNPSSDFDFSTVTNIKVFLNVVDNTTGLPVKQASISLANATAEQSWKGFTDDQGMSIFTATVAAASQTTSITVTHAGYVSVESPITGLGTLIEIGKKIAMTPEAVVTPPTDTDGDGVADSDDNYPTDPTGAKTITGVYTLAYEDLYPNKGDADFNDLVVRLTITEKIDSQNKLRQIDLKTKLLASGAGYTNPFAININGTKSVLIADPKAVSDYTLSRYTYSWSTKYTNTSSNTSGSYRDCAELTHPSIVFENGVTRESVGAMPYDPFIICNKVAGNEVHLPSVATSFTEKTKDEDGFTWALIVPETWAWPKEGASIYNAYPYFGNWCSSFGAANTDWYMTSSSSYIYTH